MFARLEHHAYCVEGYRAADAEAFVLHLCEARGVARGSADVFVLAASVFGIDDARTLRERAALRSTHDGAQFLIVAADALTREAQNALLKTVEDPIGGMHFFLLVPSAEMLLPTLRSRMEIVRVFSSAPSPSPLSDSRDAARSFLAGTTEARLEHSAALAEALAKERMTRTEVADFVSALLSETRGGEIFPKERARELRQLARAEGYARDRGASLKMLLEHLSLILPRVVHS